MRATTYRIAVCILSLVAALYAASCSNDPSSWYPSGKATIVSSYEITNSGDKSCVITFKITNTGKSTINSCVISLSAATDVRTYYKTSSTNLLSCRRRALMRIVEIVYAAGTESLKVDGLSIVDEYYQ